MRYAPLILLVAISLAGCEGLRQNTGSPAVDDYANAVKRVGLICDGYSNSLDTVSDMRDAGQLSEQARAEVSRIVDLVGPPICEKEPPPIFTNDGRSALEFIRPLVDALADIADGRT